MLLLLQLELFFLFTYWESNSVSSCYTLLESQSSSSVLLINPISCTCSEPPAALNNEAAAATTAATTSSVMTVQIQSTDYEAWWMEIGKFTSNYAQAKTDG